jgi:very-short-patch-repair endonuclease
MRKNQSHRLKIPIDATIMALAARQYGHVTRAQLLELGLTKAAIDARVRRAPLVSIHAGVYAIGPRRDDPLARAAAAVLACGPGAALSHSSAASLWEITKRWHFPLEVTHQRQRERPGIRTHTCRVLRRSDICVHLGIRVTSPARTVLDIAPMTPEKALRRAVNDLRHRGQLHLGTLAELLDRCPKHPGVTVLRPYLEHPAGPTRSEFEDAFLAFAARHHLPQPQVNVKLNGYLVDALFPDQMLIVELDGWEFHSDRTAFETDRERDAVALEAGYATVRITWERLNGVARTEAARLRRILRDRDGR